MEAVLQSTWDFEGPVESDAIWPLAEIKALATIERVTPALEISPLLNNLPSNSTQSPEVKWCV